MKTKAARKIASLESEMAVLRNQLEKCPDQDTRENLTLQIDAIQDYINDIEDAERENDEYEEATGTTPQDLYNERNAYSIRQGELIDQFRNER